jgi:2',3'-cyclic-nucleotide 2'-phosphodiesterase/3'-nucleotidase/5'-nucleotidase
MTARTWLTGTAIAALIGLGQGRVAGDPPPKNISLKPLGSFESGLFDEGAIEISAFDPETARAFVTYAGQNYVGIIDLSDPEAPVPASPLAQISLAQWGPDARSTSVAVRDGVVAIAIPQGVDGTAPGKVAFFTTDGAFLDDVTVGALPDMLTFTPNGQYVLTANEGQPRNDYGFDPEGSVSMINVRRGASGLSQADVTTIGFTQFNGAALDPSIRIFGPGSTVAQDLEPEYLAVSHDSQTAWVTLQENNAIATIDLRAGRVTSLKGLGFKNHLLPGNGLDGSRDDKAIEIENYPVLGVYMPDTIATLRAGGKTFLVTANEGDAREYAGLNSAGTEVTEVEDVLLDPATFSAYPSLQHRVNGIGRLKITRFGGDTDGDGDFDRLMAFGGRSFSVWTAEGRQVFDSGQQLEDITAEAYPDNFNASSTNNTIDDRSDDKGPEPEGVTVASVFGRTYIFVMLERIGGVVVYEATDPAAPRFVTYVNTRDITVADPEDPEAGETPGDLGPEAARFVPAEESPNGRPLLIVSNEVSGSLRVFEIEPR